MPSAGRGNGRGTPVLPAGARDLKGVLCCCLTRIITACCFVFAGGELDDAGRHENVCY